MLYFNYKKLKEVLYTMKETKMLYADLLSLCLNSIGKRANFLKKLSSLRRIDIQILPYIEEEGYSNWINFSSKISENKKIRKQLISYLFSKKSKHWWKNTNECGVIFFLYSDSHWKRSYMPEKIDIRLVEIGSDPVSVIELNIS